MSNSSSERVVKYVEYLTFRSHLDTISSSKFYSLIGIINLQLIINSNSIGSALPSFRLVLELLPNRRAISS